MAELIYLYTPLLLNTALKCCYNVISMSYLVLACKINLILCKTSENIFTRLSPKFDLFSSPGTHNTALNVGQNNFFMPKMDSAPQKTYI